MHPMLHLKSVLLYVNYTSVKLIFKKGIIKDCSDLLPIARIAQRRSRKVNREGRLKIDTVGRHRK